MKSSARKFAKTALWISGLGSFCLVLLAVVCWNSVWCLNRIGPEIHGRPFLSGAFAERAWELELRAKPANERQDLMVGRHFAASFAFASSFASQYSPEAVGADLEYKPLAAMGRWLEMVGDYDGSERQYRAAAKVVPPGLMNGIDLPEAISRVRLKKEGNFRREDK